MYEIVSEHLKLNSAYCMSQDKKRQNGNHLHQLDTCLMEETIKQSWFILCPLHFVCEFCKSASNCLEMTLILTKWLTVGLWTLPPADLIPAFRNSLCGHCRGTTLYDLEVVLNGKLCWHLMTKTIASLSDVQFQRWKIRGTHLKRNITMMMSKAFRGLVILFKHRHLNK